MHSPVETAEELPPSIQDGLSAAARVAIDERLPLDAFMAAAYAAYLQATPGLAERLADMAMMAQMESLRRDGKIGRA